VYFFVTVTSVRALAVMVPSSTYPHPYCWRPDVFSGSPSTTHPKIDLFVSVLGLRRKARPVGPTADLQHVRADNGLQLR